MAERVGEETFVVMKENEDYALAGGPSKQHLSRVGLLAV